MFKGNNNNNMARTPEANSPDRLNRIVEGTSIVGEIKSDSNIRIDGKLDGTIDTNGRLVVGPTGVIEGEVICKNADIEGVLKGKITVTGLLSLKSTAKVTGDIITDKLNIETGAVLTANVSMDNTVVKDIKGDSTKGIGQGERQKALSV